MDYFFNNDLEYLKTSNSEKTYTTSITKTIATRYEIVGIEDTVPTLWSTIKHAYDKDAAKGIKHWAERCKLCVKKVHGYGHLEEVLMKRVDRQLYKFKESLHLKYSDIVNFIVALRMFTIILVIKRRVEDLQLGVESYQKKLNIITPQQTFPEIEFKELYTPSYKPPGVIYEDLTKQKRVMRADELYKFSDGTLKKVQDELHHRILYFSLGYNDEMSRRKWTDIDKKRSELMVELIDKQMRERRIIRNLERLVGARELEMDYKLMTRIVFVPMIQPEPEGSTQRHSLDRIEFLSVEVLVSIEGVEELKRDVKIKDEKKEALLTLRQKPAKIREMNEGASDPDKKKKIVKEDVSAKIPAKQDVAEQGTKKRKSGHMKMIARKRKRPQPDVDSDDEHRKCLKIVTFEGTIDSEIMETKSFISKLDKVSSPEGDYLVVYRVNGNFRAFNYLMEVLHIFDRQDLFHLYDLVMKQYSESTPEGIELILWGDLKIMMESSIEVTDQGDFWNDQQDWEIVTWRLYEACGVCILEFKDGTVIHMLVERKYPLSKELLQRMLDFGLEVEVESTAALDLIRVLNSPCFMVKSWLVQDQTVLGKDYSNLLIADSLLKTIWFINAPCYGNEALASPKANGLTIPEQTATGKGISNPFMAGSLPKTTKPT
ncbi:hypothetical protein Tco_0690430 [Tanacetum coccineum]